MGNCAGQTSIEGAGEDDKNKKSKNQKSENNIIASENNGILITSEMLVNENKEDVSKKYIPINTIGEGSFGKVFKVKQKATGHTFALKIVKKKHEHGTSNNKNIMNEILILRKLDHPNIMKVFEYFSNESYLYYVMEYISGGELYHHICTMKFYDEYHAATIMKQIFSVVSYLNQMDIVHRDLKPENMMILKPKKEQDIEIKVIDFGTACYVKDGEKLTHKVGSPYYISPEVLKGYYGKECDAWSTGVIMYILLVGQPPFNSKNTKEIFNKIENDEPDYTISEFDYVSEEAKDLLKKLLQKNPNKRISAKEALLHPWIKKYTNINNSANKSNNKGLGLSLKNCLQTFNSKQKLHQASVAFIVHQMRNNKMIRKLTEIFKELDESGEGLLSKEELKKGYKKYFSDQLTDKEFDEIMKTIDQDKSGEISIEEFLRATVNYESLIAEKNLKYAFDYFDKDHSGTLSPDEIRDVLGLDMNDTKTKNLVKEIMKDIDTNGDGLISYEEFKMMMTNNKNLVTKEQDDEI